MDWIFSQEAGLIFPNKQIVRKVPHWTEDNMTENNMCFRNCCNCGYKTPQCHIEFVRTMGNGYRKEYICLLCLKFNYVRGSYDSTVKDQKI